MAGEGYENPIYKVFTSKAVPEGVEGEAQENVKPGENGGEKEEVDGATEGVKGLAV